MIAHNTGNVVCNTSFTNLSDSRVKTEMAEADVAELQQLFDSVEAKQYKRPDMNEDLRLGFASNDFAGTKWKNLTRTAEGLHVGQEAVVASLRPVLEAVQKRLHLPSGDAKVAHLGLLQRLRYAAETGAGILVDGLDTPQSTLVR